MIKLLILLIAAICMVVGFQTIQFWIIIVGCFLFVLGLLIKDNDTPSLNSKNMKTGMFSEYDKKPLSPLKNMFYSFKEVSSEVIQDYSKDKKNLDKKKNSDFIKRYNDNVKVGENDNESFEDNIKENIKEKEE